MPAVDEPTFRADRTEAVVQEDSRAPRARHLLQVEAQPMRTELLKEKADQRVLEKNTSDCNRNGGSRKPVLPPGGGSRPLPGSVGGANMVGEGSSGNIHNMWNLLAPAAMPV